MCVWFLLLFVLFCSPRSDGPAVGTERGGDSALDGSMEVPLGAPRRKVQGDPPASAPLSGVIPTVILHNRSFHSSEGFQAAVRDRVWYFRPSHLLVFLLKAKFPMRVKFCP